MTDVQKPPSHLISEHLANERTYLAWLRTSFALLGLGFATSRFAQFLTEMRLESERTPPRGLLIGSERFGLGMVILATILIASSSWNYQRTRREIDSGDFRPHSGFIWIISALSILFGMTAVFLLIQS